MSVESLYMAGRAVVKTIAQGVLQIVLIFRLLLKITVQQAHSNCAFTQFLAGLPQAVHTPYK